MFQSFPNFEEWDLINFGVRDFFRTESQVKTFANPYMAAYDLLISLSQLYPHKKSIALIKGLTPIYEFVLSHFIKEGYQIQKYTIEEFKIAFSNDATNFVNALKKDTLFFLTVEDHPLSGELYDYKNLDLLLNDKKIFHISLSHLSHLYRWSESFPSLNFYTCQIHHYHNDLTLIFTAEKLKMPSLVGSYQNLKSKNEIVLQLESIKFEYLKKNQSGLLSVIKEFESLFPSHSLILSSERLWDRSWILFPKVHASEFIFQMKNKGWDRLLSISDCENHWPKAYLKWPQPEIPKDWFQSSVIFLFNTPKDIPSLDEINKVLSQIDGDSQWSYD